MIKIDFFKSENGSIAVFYMILLSVLTAIVLAAASISLTNRLGIEGSYKRIQALDIAEGGVEKAIWELKSGNLSYTGETASSLISGGQFDVSVQNGANSNEKVITSTGYVPTKANPKYTKTVRVKVLTTPADADVSFAYAVQSGEGGMDIRGSSEIEGSLYSNGNIVVSGSAEVHDPGDAWAVGTITDGGRIEGNKTLGAPAMPLPIVNLDAWKNLSKSGGTISGNYAPSGNVTVGPKEITGNMIMSGSATVTLDGPLYIHGDLSMSSANASFKPSAGIGSKGTMVIVDGKINITGGKFYDNAAKGYIAFLSTNTAITENNPAISYTGNNEAERVSFYAYNGAMKLTGHGEIAAMIGQTLFISGDGDIDYEEGIPIEITFPGAPGGTWDVKEWQEIR